jgi:hypothetical protein
MPDAISCNACHFVMIHRDTVDGHSPFISANVYGYIDLCVC